MTAKEKCMLVLYENDIGESFSIDIVPEKWIFFDYTMNHLVTPFISNCSKANFQILRDLVKSEGEPLPSWPKHRISVRGSASM